MGPTRPTFTADLSQNQPCFLPGGSPALPCLSRFILVLEKPRGHCSVKRRGKPSRTRESEAGKAECLGPEVAGLPRAGDCCIPTLLSLSPCARGGWDTFPEGFCGLSSSCQGGIGPPCTLFVLFRRLTCPWCTGVTTLVPNTGDLLLSCSFCASAGGTPPIYKPLRDRGFRSAVQGT